MRNTRSLLALAAMAAALHFGFAAPAAAQAVAGKDYDPVNPAQATETKGKVEVLEFFSYGCPHCAEFEPTLGKWVKAAPKDVEFRRIPVTFGRDVWAPLAKMYYTLEAMGELERLHGAVFEAMHGARVPLNVETAQLEWLKSKNVDVKKYQDLYKSFTVQSKVTRAQQIAAAYKITGVPTIAVDGRFMTSGSKTGTYENLMRVVDSLVATSRADQKK